MRSTFPADSPLYAFTDAEVDAIFGAGTERRYAPGDVVVSEGTPGDSMYFLVEGQCEARLHSGATVRTYGPGSWFGELSFINPGHLRSATLVATQPTRLQELDQHSIETLITSHPRAIFTLVRRTTAFLVNAERTLVGTLRDQNAELQRTIESLNFTRSRLSQEEEAARTDGLTGLYNRRAFDAELESFVKRASAIGRGLALLALDLDHFKPVNDTLGHAAGDFVLTEVGKILREKVRRTDLPCRIGGDEFVVLLADLTESVAKEKAEVLRKAIGSFPHPGNGQGIRITTTMGGTMFVPGEGVETFRARADEALYDAKRAGRNRVGWR